MTLQKILTLVCALLLLFPAAANAADKPAITFGTKVEWAPYHIDLGSGADGLAVRAVACIMARMEQPFVIQKMPWARVQALTRSGRLDGFFAASKNAERDKYAQLSEPFLPQTRRLYVLKNNTALNGQALDLALAKASLKVAARHGSNALETAEKLGLSVALKPQTATELAALLAAGRIDGIVENDLVFPVLMEEAGLKAVDITDIILGEKNMGVYFGNNFLADKPGFMAAFNAQVPACSLLPAT
jgi:polar amino acid transport system substrate-binding protein